MMKKWNILVLNIGSTSSELAYCQNDEIIVKAENSFDTSFLREIKSRDKLVSFFEKLVMDFLNDNKLNVKEMDAIAVRGMGRFGAYNHGAYLLSHQVAEDVGGGPIGHVGLYASTIIGDKLSREYNIPAYLYDVVPTDEVPDIACITGIANIRRKIASHTLNCRATARAVAEEMGRDHNNSTFIIAHMGGGFCTLVYKDGIIIETHSAEEGSFTPERSGRIPNNFLVSLYTNPDYSEEDIHRMTKRNVGLFGHLGTSNCREVQERILKGDKKAKLVYEAMAYQVSKDISSLSAVVCGKVDAIILTGGIAHSEMFTGWIKERVGFIASVLVKPGSMEVAALAGGVTRVLNGEEQVNNYDEVRVRTLFESFE